MFDLHVFKAIWRIRTLKKGLHVFRGTQSNQSHLLVDAVDALGRVAEALKCEELVQWTKNELDGYAAVETVPAYRHVGCEYRGDALKCGQALQKDYLLPEEVWRQHLPVTNNTFEYKGGLSAMLDIVRDSTQARCVLRSYRDFQVVNVYNLQAGCEVIGPRCVCSRHDVLNMLTAVSAKCESRVKEIERSHPCLWKVAGAFDWILKHWKIVGLVLLLALVGSLIFCHRKVPSKYVPPVLQDYLPGVVVDRDLKENEQGDSLAKAAALSNGIMTAVEAKADCLQKRVEVVDERCSETSTEITKLREELDVVNRRNSEFQSSVACFLRTVPAGNGSDTSKFRMVQVMANDGNPDAQCDLGMMYAKGMGCGKDECKAFELVHKSAEQDCVDAQVTLGVMYYYGTGCKTNYERAVKWFSNAADRGDATAQCNLARMYDAGIGCEKDVRKALGLYEKSASQGCANAQFEMGIKFDQGEGCEKNEIRAFECFGKAAAQGHQIAIYNLGLCYEYGRGVERDLKKAEECFQDAQDGTEKRISDLALEALGRLENEKLPWWQRIAPWRW